MKKDFGTALIAIGVNIATAGVVGLLLPDKINVFDGGLVAILGFAFIAIGVRLKNGQK